MKNVETHLYRACSPIQPVSVFELRAYSFFQMYYTFYSCLFAKHNYKVLVRVCVCVCVCFRVSMSLPYKLKRNQSRNMKLKYIYYIAQV